MPTNTPNLGLIKPVVGADDDAWGGMWNSNADTLDSVVLTQAAATGKYLPLAGGTLTGSLTIGTPGINTSLTLDGVDTAGRRMLWRSSGSLRWAWGMDGTAESGSNVGSNISLYNYDDTGVALGGPALSITRATGKLNINSGAGVTGGLTFGGVVSPGGVADLSKHINLHSAGFGLSVTSARINIVAAPAGSIVLYASNADRLTVNSTGVTAAVPGIFNSGIQFGSQLASAVTDLSKHISIYSTTIGFNLTSGRLNYVTPAGVFHYITVNGNDIAVITASGMTLSTGLLTVNQTTGNNQFYGNLVVGATTTAGATLTVGNSNASSAGIILNRPLTGQVNVNFRTSNVQRFAIGFTANVETGADNYGGDLIFYRYADNGAYLGSAMTMNRATGLCTVTGDPTQPTGVATKRYVDGLLAAAGVSSFNTRTGAVTLSSVDVTTALTFTPISIGTADARYLALSGGTLTGALAVANSLAVNATAGNWASLTLTRAAGQGVQIAGYTGANPRWTIAPGDGTAESGGNTGSNFGIGRFDDAGTYLGQPLGIDRATGNVNIAQALNVAGALSVTGSATLGGLMNTGGVMYVAGNFSYWTGRDNANGLWRVVDNGNLLSSMDASGAMQFMGTAMAVGGLYPDNTSSWQLYFDGRYRTERFSAGWSWSWDATNGDYAYSTPGGSNVFFNHSDWGMVNFAGPVGGVGAFVIVSDERSKTDIEPSPHGLDVILAIEPIAFRRRHAAGPPRKDRVEHGFGARQLRAALPEAVVEMHAPGEWKRMLGDDDEPLLGVQTDAVVAAMINAIKTLHARIETLEQRTTH